MHFVYFSCASFCGIYTPTRIHTCAQWFRQTVATLSARVDKMQDATSKLTERVGRLTAILEKRQRADDGAASAEEGGGKRQRTDG